MEDTWYGMLALTMALIIQAVVKMLEPTVQTGTNVVMMPLILFNEVYNLKHKIIKIQTY